MPPRVKLKTETRKTSQKDIELITKKRISDNRKYINKSDQKNQPNVEIKLEDLKIKMPERNKDE